MDLAAVCKADMDSVRYLVELEAYFRSHEFLDQNVAQQREDRRVVRRHLKQMARMGGFAT
jgi:hypothetical protein